MTPTEIRAALHRIESTTQILDLRTSGNSNLIPAPFEKYTNAQLCASMLRELIELTDHYKTEAG